MMEIIILSVLLLSCLAGVILFALHMRRDRAKALLCFLLCTFVPVAGVVLSITALIRFKRGRYAMDTEETIRKIKIKESEYLDEERLMNTVPAHDALSISTNRERRGYMRGLLRQYEMESLKTVLHQAIHNADSEASHYAASAVMELQRLSYNSMAEAGAEYEKNPDDYETAKRYAATILDYLGNSEIGAMENSVFRSRYETVMLHIMRDLSGSCSEDDYENLVRMYLWQNRLEDAWIWGRAYTEAYPNDETGYLLLLEIAYTRMDSGAFNSTLDSLRSQRGITLSHEGLTSIRFWLQNRVPGGKAL